MISFRCLLATSLIPCASLISGDSRGATFLFGSSQNNFNNSVSASLTSGTYGLQIGAVLPGSRLNEPESAGMGINSTLVAGATDPTPGVFNLLGGNGPNVGLGEAIQLSFDKPGVITILMFDGVKDESLEYFILDVAGGPRVNFFDSAANISVPGAVDQAIAAGAITGTIVYLLEGGGFDDDSPALQIPFSTGQQFTLTYAELGRAFHPTLDGNGARFQAITVRDVPEPAAAVLLAIFVIFGCVRPYSRAQRHARV